MEGTVILRSPCGGGLYGKSARSVRAGGQSSGFGGWPRTDSYWPRFGDHARRRCSWQAGPRRRRLRGLPRTDSYWLLLWRRFGLEHYTCVLFSDRRRRARCGRRRFCMGLVHIHVVRIQMAYAVVPNARHRGQGPVSWLRRCRRPHRWSLCRARTAPFRRRPGYIICISRWRRRRRLGIAISGQD